MSLAPFLKQQISLSPEAESTIQACSTAETFQKNAIVLRTENRSKRIWFLASGLARVYYAKDGREITLYFLEAGNFALPVDSIFYGSVCRYGIQALEKCSFVSLKYSDWENAMRQCTELERYCMRMLVAYIKRMNDKLYGQAFQPARERFELMQAQYPGILLRAPLGDIASYLGITQETLSRLQAGR